MRQVKALSFAGQDIYCGTDVHKKDWSVCIRDDDRELRTFCQPPAAESLSKFLKNNYPDASYHVVYEAGFCGFWIQQQLAELGIECLVVNPSDVPTSDKDRSQKTDKVDCRKLALELSKGSLKGIHIPPSKTIEDRLLVRTRDQLVIDQTRQKNRILSVLHFMGKPIPPGYKTSTHFSKRFIVWLQQLDLHGNAKVALELKLSSLQATRQSLLQANRSLRKLSESSEYKTQVALLRSIPGIGLINAMVLLTELEDIKRFKNFDRLCSYAGLKPDIYSSSDRMYVKQITDRANTYIREALVESAWKAISHEPVLLMAYKDYVKRMHYNKAIIRIAKKLLNRIRFVLINQTPYVAGVVE